MVYNFAFFAMAVALFFGGPTFWPDKRARLFGGYTAFLVSLAGAALVGAQTPLAPPSLSAAGSEIFISAQYSAHTVQWPSHTGTHKCAPVMLA
jgi:hypothetical protein